MKDKDEAWKRYLAFVDKAGTLTFADLCRSAGLRVPYEQGTIRDIGAGIRDWLKEHVFSIASLTDPDEWIRAITGESLNPDYYLSYLEEKYSKLYELK